MSERRESASWPNGHAAPPFERMSRDHQIAYLFVGNYKRFLASQDPEKYVNNMIKILAERHGVPRICQPGFTVNDSREAGRHWGKYIFEVASSSTEEPDVEIVRQIAAYFSWLSKLALTQFELQNPDDFNRLGPNCWMWVQFLDHNFFGAAEKVLLWGEVQIMNHLNRRAAREAGADGAVGQSDAERTVSSQSPPDEWAERALTGSLFPPVPILTWKPKPKPLTRSLGIGYAQAQRGEEGISSEGSTSSGIISTEARAGLADINEPPGIGVHHAQQGLGAPQNGFENAQRGTKAANLTSLSITSDQPKPNPRKRDREVAELGDGLICAQGSTSADGNVVKSRPRKPDELPVDTNNIKHSQEQNTATPKPKGQLAEAIRLKRARRAQRKKYIAARGDDIPSDQKIIYASDDEGFDSTMFGDDFVAVGSLSGSVTSSQSPQAGDLAPKTKKRKTTGVSPRKVSSTTPTKKMTKESPQDTSITTVTPVTYSTPTTESHTQVIGSKQGSASSSGERSTSTNTLQPNIPQTMAHSISQQRLEQQNKEQAHQEPPSPLHKDISPQLNISPMLERLAGEPNSVLTNDPIVQNAMTSMIESFQAIRGQRVSPAVPSPTIHSRVSGPATSSFQSLIDPALRTDLAASMQFQSNIQITSEKTSDANHAGPTQPAGNPVTNSISNQNLQANPVPAVSFLQPPPFSYAGIQPRLSQSNFTPRASLGAGQTLANLSQAQYNPQESQVSPGVQNQPTRATNMNEKDESQSVTSMNMPQAQQKVEKSTSDPSNSPLSRETPSTLPARPKSSSSISITAQNEQVHQQLSRSTPQVIIESPSTRLQVVIAQTVNQQGNAGLQQAPQLNAENDVRVGSIQAVDEVDEVGSMDSVEMVSTVNAVSVKGDVSSEM